MTKKGGAMCHMIVTWWWRQVEQNVYKAETNQGKSITIMDTPPRSPPQFDLDETVDYELNRYAFAHSTVNENCNDTLIFLPPYGWPPTPIPWGCNFTCNSPWYFSPICTDKEDDTISLGDDSIFYSVQWNLFSVCYFFFVFFVFFCFFSFFLCFFLCFFSFFSFFFN